MALKILLLRYQATSVDRYEYKYKFVAKICKFELFFGNNCR